MPSFDPLLFCSQLEDELVTNILPFWMQHTVDRVNGGFFGAVTNDLKIHNEIPRSAILCARILWTYASAYRRYGDEKYLSMATHAYDTLRKTFWDPQYGGVYWTVDAEGAPAVPSRRTGSLGPNGVLDRKHHYAQAFAIYGLAEYYKATQDRGSLTMAQDLFRLLEQHGFDPLYGGYIEGSSRQWEALADMRLSERDLDCRKSMNTLLHILEAYTNLMRMWAEPELKKQHRALMQVFFDHVIDPREGHLKLFFDDQWNSLLPHVSYGHDIEASWLLVEAAEVQGDPDLLAQTREAAVRIAGSVYADGLEDDGSIPYERGPKGLVDANRSWWVQSEAVVGFYNAYQISGEEEFAESAFRCWEYIRTHLVDREYGDWFKRLHPDGTLELGSFKAGPWECPYHHSRMCFEMIERLRQ
jgi:mannobiose 2-epimerase